MNPLDDRSDPRDQLLLAQCPVAGAPRHGPWQPLHAAGQRMLLAANGVFLEVRTPVLYALQQVGQLDPALTLPYGPLRNAIQFSFGAFPRALVEQFIAAARYACPEELAGALVYHCVSRQLRLVLHKTVHGGSASVDYRMKGLAAQELVALDLHSHGLLPACFSPADDRDDQGICVAGVVGELDCEHPSAAFRLCLNGSHFALPHPWRVARAAGGDPSPPPP